MHDLSGESDFLLRLFVVLWQMRDDRSSGNANPSDLFIMSPFLRFGEDAIIPDLSGKPVCLLLLFPEGFPLLLLALVETGKDCGVTRDDFLPFITAAVVLSKTNITSGKKVALFYEYLFTNV